ncbi:hypothetical protein GobsT_17940 [Gemmata obscuriglobus]|uniref:DNA-directed DNA polymerase family A palm domain-containing protein n=1 Tax=Gemmata obscuriglobus TaxID=114 RepID=A0A2Z3H8D2_9BACT|nr:hypothetical protein [Gemmata obscuriglobus]AWM39836.1 hypothetical protein C1280_24395 [Gemmata obscuriglobus]QEG27041.1 hypothetical protein GobsT_17940 [Gemmata obscuriglobus]VTS03416.1 Putative uncharacterized protein OS=Rhodopirellula baltica (strain SH1) GN=RB11637 PE=4 SV=1 [Gemmata obscuriglobus UQM 2246]
MKYVWNPHDFDPLNFLPAALRRQSDAARVLVHQIEFRRLDKRHRADEWVTLQAKYLRNVVGVDHCEAIRDCLASEGVISVKRSFVVGQKSFEFKIGPRFQNSMFRRFPITDKFLLRRMGKHLGRTGPKADCPTELALYSWLKGLTIDADGARDYVRAHGGAAEWVRQKTLTVDMLAERDLWFTRDRFGRIHTNFTNLWSGLRRFLSVGGSPLVEMDIANSQPLFFGLLAMVKWRSSQEASSQCQQDVEECRNNSGRITNVNSKSILSPPPLLSLYDAGIHHGNIRRSLPPDLAEYLGLVERGDFYEHLMRKARLTWAKRSQFKDSFFQHVFYAKRVYRNPIANVFRKEFPTAHAVLTAIKKSDPRDAPHKMQQLEADFVIGTCCRKLSADHPAVPLLTLHDGIWTTPDHIGLVRRTVQDEFAKLGVRPLLRCRAASDLSLPPGASVQTRSPGR